jgi:hypothetical protein
MDWVDMKKLPLCIYAGTNKCFGKLYKDSDDSAIGSVGGAQSDSITLCCIWLKNWIYCPYL